MYEFTWCCDIPKSHALTADHETKTLQIVLSKQSFYLQLHRYKYQNYNLFKIRFDLIQQHVGEHNTPQIKRYWGGCSRETHVIRHWFIKWSHVLQHYINY